MPRPKLASRPGPNIRLAKTPEREAELVEAFQRKLKYIAQSYVFWKSEDNRTLNFNDSLDALKRVTSNPDGGAAFSVPLHLRMSLMIAAKLDAATDGRPSQRTIELAAQVVSEVAKAIRGRPKNPILDFHVFGLVALIEETSGFPAHAKRDKNSVYSPHMANESAKFIEEFFQTMDPRISTTTLVRLVRHAVCEGNVNNKRFVDYFPMYGARINPENGTIEMQPGYRVEMLKPVYPIYCP